MQEVVGRLFRQFAVTLAITSRSHFSLPDVRCRAKLLRSPEAEASSRASSRWCLFSSASHGGYLGVGARHQPFLAVAVALTLALTIRYPIP